MVEVSLPPDVPELIFGWYDKNAEDWRRDHLGASVIGDACDRKLWYSYRWSVERETTGRMRRLFETGHREEVRVIGNLRAIGLQVFDVNPKTGKQYRVSFHGGLMGGSADGIVLGVPGAEKTPHLLEIKTMASKYFNKLAKHGLEKSNPEYVAQMQVYMKGLKLRRGLFVAVGKNTDDMHAERIHYDKVEADRQVERGRLAIESDSPTARISEDPTFWRCHPNFCQFAGVCHRKSDPGPLPLRNCRTCLSYTNGEGCSLHGPRLLAEQKKGCQDHLYIPGLLHWWDAVDSSEDPRRVTYQAGDQQVEDREYGLHLADGSPADLAVEDPAPTDK